MADWQDISTAPRDGTRIRLGNDKEPGFGTKNPHGFGAVSGNWNDGRWRLSAFFLLPGGRCGMLSGEPTHWMALPDQGSTHAQ